MRSAGPDGGPEKNNIMEVLLIIHERDLSFIAAVLEGVGKYEKERGLKIRLTDKKEEGIYVYIDSK